MLLTSGVQNIHDTIDHLAYVDATFTAATFGRGDQRVDICPLNIGQIARVANLDAVGRVRHSVVHKWHLTNWGHPVSRIVSGRIKQMFRQSIADAYELISLRKGI